MSDPARRPEPAPDPPRHRPWLHAGAMLALVVAVMAVLTVLQSQCVVFAPTPY